MKLNGNRILLVIPVAIALNLLFGIVFTGISFIEYGIACLVITGFIALLFKQAAELATLNKPPSV